MTPFQVQVYEAEKARQAEAKEKKMEQARSGGGPSGAGGRPRNSLAGGGTAGATESQSETVRYQNDGGSSKDTVDFVD